MKIDSKHLLESILNFEESSPVREIKVLLRIIGSLYSFPRS